MPRNTKGLEIAEIIPDRCISCQICIGECPTGAIQLSAEGAVIDPEACVGCGKCFNVCPVGAVRFEKKEDQKAAPAIKKDSTGGLGDYQGWPSL